jgi:hypothetical protein
MDVVARVKKHPQATILLGQPCPGEEVIRRRR